MKAVKNGTPNPVTFSANCARLPRRPARLAENEMRGFSRQIASHIFCPRLQNGKALESVIRRRTRIMSTFTLKEHGNILVTLPEGLTEEQVLSFHPFTVS